jgi:TolB-like protein/Flp pilus assembly protein TadD
VNPFDASRRVLKFGVFEADLAAGELRKNGMKIRLQDQPFQVLAMLLENPGQVVSRDELRRKLWPADTFVDFDNGLNTAINKIREALGDSAEHPQFIETLPRRGYRFLQTLEHKAEKPIDTIVVLPLENLSHDPEQEYFAEGMTEALITTLAKIGALRVVSRTTAMHYKGVRRPLREIANELQVGAVVEGTVHRSGDRVRISAQLIDAQADIHLWAESYDRDLRDILALQSEVAQAIAREIQVKLTPQEKALFAQVHPIDPQAYEAYLKGRYYWNRRSPDGFPKALQYFEEAIAKDPGFAAAYAGLADCLSGLSGFAIISPAAGLGKAKELAFRALELDPGLAEAHASVAWVKMWYDYDFAGAEKEFERSLALNPRYPTAHSWFGFFLGLMGRYEEAYTECQRAIRLDPLSSPIHWVLGFVYYMARRYAQAIKQLETLLEFDPNFAWAHSVLAYAYLGESLTQPAIAAAEKEVQLSPNATLSLSTLALAYASAGLRQEAQKILERLDALSKQQYVSPYLLARAYTALGDNDEAIRLIEAAFHERTSLMVYLKTDSQLDGLRSEPRFRELMRRMNYPPDPHCTLESR